jgi:hypothetical protein
MLSETGAAPTNGCAAQGSCYYFLAKDTLMFETVSLGVMVIKTRYTVMSILLSVHFVGKLRFICDLHSARREAISYAFTLRYLQTRFTNDSVKIKP